MESNYSAPTTKKRPVWLDTFLPNQEVKVTPIIISLNILVWIAMIANGVSPYFPSAEDALAWGATSSSAVVNGDYWRLLTSNYIHFGFLHLGVNMFSLNNVGRTLERFIGPWRFLVLYTVTGIAGSAISIWWNQYAVGAGASGAIVGIVGVFAALLTTNLIDKAIRMSMLRSIGISIGIMLLLGLNSHVDNAAHIGGLLAGAVGGYCIYPDIKAHYLARKEKWLGLIAALLIMMGASVWFVTQSKGGSMRDANQIFESFATEEAVVIETFNKGGYTSPEQIQTQVLPVYKTGLLRIDTISEMDLNEQGEKYMAQYKQYMSQRIKHFEFTAKAMNDPKFADSAAAWSNKADQTIQIINSGE